MIQNQILMNEVFYAKLSFSFLLSKKNDTIYEYFTNETVFYLDNIE